jgi:diguanylate cyclase (GGDEF)-like protein
MVDLPTLIAVGVSAKAGAGMLLIYAWVTNRYAPSLALWAIAFLVASAATVIIVSEQRVSFVRLIDIADALLIAAYALLWMGARSFNSRRTPVAYLLVAPATWFLLRHLVVFHHSDSIRVIVLSSIVFCYLVLTGIEFWRSNRNLTSCWPLIVIIGLHAAAFLSRVFWPGWMLRSLTGSRSTTSVTALIFFELLFQTVFAAFLLAFLVKERREEHYRRDALVDPLTGVWNRRAFLDYAARRLSRAAIDKHPVALVAFDLDRFKLINDRYGHPAGDQVLCAFCKVVTEALRPGDLFGRIGGEEFASLLVNISPVDAVAMAERLRRRFASMKIYSGPWPLRATVSSGVAIAEQPQPDLEVLMAAADLTLYRAKKLGRNRVELDKTKVQCANCGPNAQDRQSVSEL